MINKHSLMDLNGHCNRCVYCDNDYDEQPCDECISYFFQHRPKKPLKFVLRGSVEDEK